MDACFALTEIHYGLPAMSKAQKKYGTAKILLGLAIYQRLPFVIGHHPDCDVGKNDQRRRDHKPHLLPRAFGPPAFPSANQQQGCGEGCDRKN